MKGQNVVNGIILVGFSLVTFVVVAAIIDDVITTSSTTYPASQGGINLSSGSLVLTACGNGVTPNSQVCTNWSNAAALTEGVDYNITDITCTLYPNKGVFKIGNAKLNCTYEYAAESTFSSPTSRNIASYIVPIAIIGALALAVGFLYFRFR